MSQNKNCSLHSLSFQYFCERCYQPVCRQCTLIGPHNTQIHAITNIATAYERRVNQIQYRISSFLQNKEGIISSMTEFSSNVEQLKEMKQLCLKENQIYKNKMLLDLQKSYQRISNQINLVKEEFQIKLNQINDLGHSFETTANDIQIIALKECCDRLSLLLAQTHQFQQLPKQLSSLRLDLKKIEVYKDLITKKTQLIADIFLRLDKQKLKIQQPTIDYPQLLKELSINIDRCSEHNVCHYCGVVLTIERTNTLCSKNNSNLDINLFVGLCANKPDASKWATHRHFFGAPREKLSYFKIEENSSFKVHLQALLLKLKTVCKINKIKLQRKFESADKNGEGYCDKISMMYMLRQVCGLRQDQSQILISICSSSLNAYKYGDLLSRLQTIAI